MDDESALAAARIVAALETRFTSGPRRVGAIHSSKLPGADTPGKQRLEQELQKLASLVDDMLDRGPKFDPMTRDKSTMTSDDDLGLDDGEHGADAESQHENDDELLDDLVQELADIDDQIREQNELHAVHRSALTRLTESVTDSGQSQVLGSLSKAFDDVEEARKSTSEISSRLGSTIHRFRQTTKSARPSENNITRLFASLSNEIRTPINGIRGMTEMALNTDMTPNQRELLDGVQASADCLGALMDQAVTFSKIDSGNLRVEEVPLRLRHTIIRALEPLVAEAKEKDCTITLTVRDSIPDYILGNSFRLREVIQSLARKFIGHAGHGQHRVPINVSPGLTPNNVGVHSIEFSIRPSIYGLGGENYPWIRLMDSLQRVSESNSPSFGSEDLDLFIIKGLVQHMGGKLWVEYRGTSSYNGPIHSIHFTIRSRMASDHGNLKAIQRRLEPVRSHQVLVIGEEQSSFGANIKAVLEEMGLQPLLADIGHAVQHLLRESIRRAIGTPQTTVVVDSIATAGELRARAHLRTPPPVVVVMNPSAHIVIPRAVGIDIASYVAAPGDVATLGMAMIDALDHRHVPNPTFVKYAALGSMEILIADDNAVNRKLLSKYLEKLHCRFTLAVNGAEAVEAVKRKKFDAILMDTQMPVMVTNSPRTIFHI